MVGISAREGVIVDEYSTRLFKGNRMLPEVRGGLSLIPVEAHTVPRLALSAEQPEQRVITDQHQSEPHRHAEHEGEGKVRHAVELEEQCRENPEQRERPQDETDSRLQDREEHEHRQPEHVPKKPERAWEKSPAVEIGYGHTGRRSLAN